MSFTPIDMSKVPVPDVVETLDFETILAELLEDFNSQYPEFSALLESDPAYKGLEVAAYREVRLRQRVNDAARAVMVASATGADLDNLGAFVPLERKILDEGDADARPVILPTYEDDEDFRRRVQMAPEGLSPAGPSGAYEFHALTVTDVVGAKAVTPSPGRVAVYILSRFGNGVPDESLINAVDSALNDEKIRPLTDFVTIYPAEIVEYQVNAILYIQSGPAPAAVVDSASAAVTAYVSSKHAMGTAVPLSGIYAALHVEGVEKVELLSPLADLNMAKQQASYCTNINVEVG